jgi:XTP/dITP diphosphohydrolase
MHTPTPLVIATRNSGKLFELQRLLNGFPVAVRSLSDFGPIPQVEETGSSFEENAYLKASHTSRVLGLPALADDSGLAVAALNGAPGVHSARFAGEGASDEANWRLLLQRLADAEDRRAAFVCVLSIAVPNGRALTYEGRCEGLIMPAPRGSGGFGYDPVFYYPPMKCSFAEMSTEEKNRVSHRGSALRELRQEFDKVLLWIRQQMPIEEPGGCLGPGEGWRIRSD